MNPAGQVWRVVFLYPAFSRSPPPLTPPDLRVRQKQNQVLFRLCVSSPMFRFYSDFWALNFSLSSSSPLKTVTKATSRKVPEAEVGETHRELDRILGTVLSDGETEAKNVNGLPKSQ